MSFINMLSAWQWALLALVPPAIVALYFLKLKRQPLEVPSTYLWVKSIEDLHVNSIWQRLRKNLLLLLQLLVLLLLILALLRPNWRESALVGERFVFLVDNSASMLASDVSPTRLDEAKRRIGELIEQMTAGDQAMIIAFADNAQVVREFTDNRRELRERLATIRATHRPTDLLGALELAAEMSNRELTSSYTAQEKVDESIPADVYIFSDGKFPDVVGFSLGALRPVYIPIGSPDTPNVAITAFSAQRKTSQPSEVQAIAQVENFGDEPVDVTLGLYFQGMSEVVDAQQVHVEPESATGVVFELGEIESAGLRLQIETEDALAVDNAAYAAVVVPRRGRVLLVTPGNRPLERALSTPKVGDLAEVTVTTAADYPTKFAPQAAAAAFDLVIYDQQLPAELKMPQSNTLFLGVLPPLDSWKPGEAKQVTGPQIFDVERDHPIMQFLDLGDIAIDSSYALTPPPASTVLIDSTAGPLMAIAPRDGFEDAVLGFEIYGHTDAGEIYANTTWVIRLSFPTFVFQAIGYLAGQQNSGAAFSARPGEVVQLRSRSQAATIEVRDPSNETHAVRRSGGNTFNFSGTRQTGLYQTLEAGQPTGQFAVNLFDPGESQIATRPDNTIQIGYVDVEGQATWEPARREIWKWLVVLVLVVLLVEWYIYNRRVYV